MGPEQENIRRLPLPPTKTPEAIVQTTELGGVKISAQGLELNDLNARATAGGGASFNFRGLEFPVTAETEKISFKNIGNGKVAVEVADRPVDGQVIKQSFLIDILGQASNTKQWTEAQTAPSNERESVQSEMQELEARMQELVQKDRDLSKTELQQERNGILSEITGKEGWSVGDPDSKLGIIRSRETVGIYNPQGKCIGNVSADESFKPLTAEIFRENATALINK